jgi:Ca2+-binding RTX toxin-like protein
MLRFVQQMFGQRRNHLRIKPRRSTFKVEQLDERQLLAVGVSFNAITGHLSFYGGATNDMVEVDYLDFGSRSILVTLTNDNVSRTQLFSTSNVRQLNFYGYGGSDVFKNRTNISSYAEGGIGDDYLVGGNAGDRLLGGDGIDVIVGNCGNDYLDGQGNRDYVHGGCGNDSVYGGEGNDYLTGDQDTYTLNPNNDFISGGPGDDTIEGGLGNDTISGGDDNDSMIGGRGNDSMWGGAGHDRLDGQEGNDLLVGGRGGNIANSGNDTIVGGTGKDSLYGQDGDDELDGGNNLKSDGVIDYVNGGTGIDTAVRYRGIFMSDPDQFFGIERYSWRYGV